MDYTGKRTAVLERLSAAGDSDAAAELKRRKDGGAAPVLAPEQRKARKLIGWQRPLASTFYPWWPPQVGQPSFEMHTQANEYWSREREREREQLKSRGYVVDEPRLEEERS